MTAPRLAAVRQDEPTIEPSGSESEPVHAAARWREHDLMIRRFHNAALTPAEIAVVLHSKGLRVNTWHVSETFVRNRMKALGLTPNLSRDMYLQGQNRYRLRQKPGL